MNIVNCMSNFAFHGVAPLPATSTKILFPNGSTTPAAPSGIAMSRNGQCIYYATENSTPSLVQTYLSRDGGATFTLLPTFPKSNMSYGKVCVSDDGKYILCAGYNTTPFLYYCSGADLSVWETRTLPTNVSCHVRRRTIHVRVRDPGLCHWHFHQRELRRQRPMG